MKKSKGTRKAAAPVKPVAPKPDPYTTRTFNPATVERKKQIESFLRQGKTNQQIYESIKGSGSGGRKQDVLDYTRYLRDQQQITSAIEKSDKQVIESLPMGVTYQSKQYKYIVTGIAKKGEAGSFEFGVTVNSDRALTKAQIEANAMRLVDSNPDHYVKKEDQDLQAASGDMRFNKLDIAQAFSKNPTALNRTVLQQDRNIQYRIKQREKERKKKK